MYEGKEFNDPIVRCYNCTHLVHRKFVSKNGGCVHCGNRRFTNVRGMNDTEYNGLKTGELEIGLKIPYTIDPEFLALFEPAEEICASE